MTIQTPSSAPRTGALPGILLLFASTMPTAAAVLLTPILPQLQQRFADSPLPVPLILSAPALMIAIFAPFAGQIVDRLGRRRILLASMIVYAFVASAPAWLPESIVGSSLAPLLGLRLLVGICEAGITTAATTLIADYYQGNRRNKYLGLQTLFTTISAVVFITIGGALGLHGWQAPFWVYLLSLVIVVPMFWAIREPQPHTEAIAIAAIDGPMPIPWRRVGGKLAVTVFGGLAFFVILAEGSLIYAGLGIADPQLIGGLTAIGAVATAVGAVLFPSLMRFGNRVLLTFEFLVLGAGLILVWGSATAGSVPGVLIGAIVVSFASGLLLPTLLVWTIDDLHFAERGRVTGLWNASFFLGQFLCPIAIAAIQGPGGADALPLAVGVVGIAAVVIGAGVAARVRTPAPTPTL